MVLQIKIEDSTSSGDVHRKQEDSSRQRHGHHPSCGKRGGAKEQEYDVFPFYFSPEWVQHDSHLAVQQSHQCLSRPLQESMGSLIHPSRLAEFSEVGLELRRIADKCVLVREVGRELRRIADQICPEPEHWEEDRDDHEENLYLQYTQMREIAKRNSHHNDKEEI